MRLSIPVSSLSSCRLLLKARRYCLAMLLLRTRPSRCKKLSNSWETLPSFDIWLKISSVWSCRWPLMSSRVWPRSSRSPSLSFMTFGYSLTAPLASIICWIRLAVWPMSWATQAAEETTSYNLQLVSTVLIMAGDTLDSYHDCIKRARNYWREIRFGERAGKLTLTLIAMRKSKDWWCSPSRGLWAL